MVELDTVVELDIGAEENTVPSAGQAELAVPQGTPAAVQGHFLQAYTQKKDVKLLSCQFA